MVASNPIPDDVWVNERPLAQIGAPNRTTVLGKGFQAVACSDQLSRQVLGSDSVKPGDVTVDMMYAA
jgi:hypothetical protein